MTTKSMQRNHIILRRKNFLPSLIITITLGLFLGGLVYFTEPDNSFVIFAFFLCLFSFLFFMFSLLLASSRKGLIFSICLTVFTILRYFGIGNILNAILISGLVIISLLYERFTKRGN